MRKFLRLVLILLKNSYAPLATGKRAKIKSIALIVLLLFSFAPMSMALAMGVMKIYVPLAAIGQEGVILALACGVASVLILFFGIFYVINVYYFSQDVETLLPLPLRPWQILAGKFSVTLIFEYLTQLFILAPVLIAFGIKSGAGVNYYLIALMIFLLLPIIPLLLASAISLLVMSIIPAGRYKDILRIWGGLIGLVAALGFNYFYQRLASIGDKGQIFVALQSGGNSLVQFLGHIFPGLKWLVAALLQQGALMGWGWVLLYITITFSLLTIFFAIAERLYFRTVLRGSGTYAARQKLDSQVIARGSRPLPPLWSLMLKEWRLLVRTPAYFMNCVIINFIWPVMLIFMSVTSTGKGFSAMREWLAQQSLPPDLVLLIGLAVGLFISGTNATSASGISRDGAQFFIAKSIPIDYRLQLAAKMLVAFLLSTCGLLILLAMLSVWFKIPPMIVAIAFFGSLVGMLFGTGSGMLLDIHFPRLTWDNEYRAVKQNVGVMVNVFLGFGLAALVAFLAFKFKATGWTRASIVVGFFLLLDAAIIYLLHQFIPRWIKNIQI